MPDLLKLTAFFNETLESGDGLAARRVLDEFQAAEVHTSILLRGIEGFGAHHRLHSELHEAGTLNQPVAAIAVDSGAADSRAAARRGAGADPRSGDTRAGDDARGSPRPPGTIPQPRPG